MIKLPNNRATNAYIDKLDKIRNNAPPRQSQALIDAAFTLPTKKTNLTNTTFSEEEAQRRLEAALHGAFSGPPTPLKDIPKKSGESRSLK